MMTGRSGRLPLISRNSIKPSMPGMLMSERITMSCGSMPFASLPSASSVPLVIFSRARLGLDPSVNAVATVIIVVVAIGVTLASILVARNERYRSHLYEARAPKEQTQRQIAGDLLKRAFEGSAKSLVLGALAAQPASGKDLAEIRSLLDEFEKRRGDK